MSVATQPFEIAIEQAQLDDLKQRLAAVRWPDAESTGDWRQGIPLDYTQEICRYWENDYDWRRCEKTLNSWPNFRSNIDGVDIHFIHARSPHENAIPLIMTHGWPGSVIEFYKVIDPLVNPTAHGGSEADAFHIVCPSLPGYGFSGRPTENGWSVQKIAAAWDQLMQSLGYSSYYAQGGDWGSIVTHQIAMAHADNCRGIHVNMALAVLAEEHMANMTETEAKQMADLGSYMEDGSGYSKQQSTRPQTLGYGLADSPTGQAAWIIEKFYEWCDCGEGDDRHPEQALTKDEMLDNVMLYWLTNTGASSARLYWESFGDMNFDPIEIPVGLSIFPKEISRTSKRGAETRYKNLVHFNELQKGGHFAAFEQPELFVEELRQWRAALPQ